jgi:secreted PhoX family phosphatase
MNDRTKLTDKPIDMDDVGYNESANPSFDTILSARLSRRNFMLGSASTGAMASLRRRLDGRASRLQ